MDMKKKKKRKKPSIYTSSGLPYFGHRSQLLDPQSSPGFLCSIIKMLVLREGKTADVTAEIYSVCALNAETFRFLPPNSSPQQKAHLFISKKTQVRSNLIF